MLGQDMDIDPGVGVSRAPGGGVSRAPGGGRTGGGVIKRP